MFREEWNSWKRMPRLICLRSMNRSTGHWSGCGKCDRICRHQHAVWKTFLTLHLLWTVGECCTSMDQQDWARPNGRAVFYLKLLSYLTVTSYGIATLAKELSSMISTYLIGLHRRDPFA